MSKNFKTLFRIFQKLDYRDKDNSAKKKLIGILTGYLFANTVLSYSFYITFDEKSFVILAMTSNLFLLALIVLTDFENLFLASRSSDLLRTLPVGSESVFRAKFLSAVLFLLMFILASSIPQVIFFWFLSADLPRTLAFLILQILFCYFSTGILLLIYMFALSYFRNKASTVVNILQIVFFFFIFYSTTLSSKATSAGKELLVRLSILDVGAVRYMPQTFFAEGVFNIYYFILSVCLSGAILLTLYFVISKNYYTLLEKVSDLNLRKKLSVPKLNFSFLNKFADRYVISNNYELASFHLVKDQLQNSKFLKVKYFPVILMPLMFVIIGIVTDSPHLLFFNKETGTESFFKTAILVMSPSITFTLIMCSRLLISNTKILDNRSAGTEWIYDSLPVKDKRYVIKGTMKYVYFHFLIPLILLIGVLLSFKTDVATVLLNILFVFSGMYFINSVAMLFDKAYPFTFESSKFNSASKFLEVFFAMFLGIVLFLIQIFVFQNIIFVLITATVLITVSFLLNRN